MTDVDSQCENPYSEGSPDTKQLLEFQFRIYDGLLAVGLFVCFLIGLPGNILSLKYFLNTKKRNLSTLLYIAACSIDLGTSIIHLPIAVNLLNERKPGILKNSFLCQLWYFLFLLLQTMSMFVVMLLSVSRAIAILFPFFRVSKCLVLLSILIYFVFHVIMNSIYFANQDTVYVTASGLCHLCDDSSMTAAYVFIYTACLFVPPVVVFIAVLASISKLRTEDTTETSQRRNHQASVTIAYFSSLFLLCNSLTYTNMLLYKISVVKDEYPGRFYNNNFMFFYSWLLAELVTTVLNASLNPLLYLWRIQEMRTWMLGLLP